MLDHVRVNLSKVGVLAALLCLGAAKSSAETTKTPAWVVVDIISVALVVVVLAGLVVWIILIARRFAEHHTEEEREALRFEAEMGRVLSMEEVPSDEDQAPSSREEAASPEQPVEPLAQTDLAAAAQAASLSDAGRAVDSVLAKIRAAGLYAGMEGRIYLSDGETEGLIIRLTNGKTAVVLPRVEPADFLARQIKRFDLCIVPLVGDQVGVLSPVGQYIADNVPM